MQLLRQGRQNLNVQDDLRLCVAVSNLPPCKRGIFDKPGVLGDLVRHLNQYHGVSAVPGPNGEPVKMPGRTDA